MQRPKRGEPIDGRVLVDNSIKYDSLLGEIAKGEKAIIYSEYKKSGGIHTIARLLTRQLGFTQWKPGQPLPKVGGKAFAVYDGDTAFADRTSIMQQFDRDAFRVLLMTSAGAEGLNTKRVMQVHVMEPFWHNVRLEQVVGRARRATSHVDLPPEKRVVKIWVYVARRSHRGARTTDEDRWSVAEGKRRISLAARELGFLPAAIESYVDPKRAARNMKRIASYQAHADIGAEVLHSMRRARIAHGFRMARPMDADTIERDARTLINRCIVAKADGGSLRRFDRLHNISALPRLLHGDAPRYDAAPWVAPVVRGRLRLGVNPRNIKGNNGDFRDINPSQFAHLDTASGRLLTDSNKITHALHSILREADDDDMADAELRRRLYGDDGDDDLRTQASDNRAIVEDATAPLRLFYPPTTAPSHGAERAVTHPTRAVVLPFDDRTLAQAVEDEPRAHAWRHHRMVKRKNRVQWVSQTDRVDLWPVHGEYATPPPVVISDIKPRNGCSRCGTASTMQTCVPGNRYEPAKLCMKHVTDDRASKRVLQAMTTASMYPPNPRDAGPARIEGERLHVLRLVDRYFDTRYVDTRYVDTRSEAPGTVPPTISRLYDTTTWIENPGTGDRRVRPARDTDGLTVSAEAIRRSLRDATRLVPSARRCAALALSSVLGRADLGAADAALIPLRAFRAIDIGELHPDNPVSRLVRAVDNARTMKALSQQHGAALGAAAFLSSIQYLRRNARDKYRSLQRLTPRLDRVLEGATRRYKALRRNLGHDAAMKEAERHMYDLLASRAETSPSRVPTIDLAKMFPAAYLRPETTTPRDELRYLDIGAGLAHKTARIGAQFGVEPHNTVCLEKEGTAFPVDGGRGLCPSPVRRDVPSVPGRELRRGELPAGAAPRQDRSPTRRRDRTGAAPRRGICVARPQRDRRCDARVPPGGALHLTRGSTGGLRCPGAVHVPARRRVPFLAEGGRPAAARRPTLQEEEEPHGHVRRPLSQGRAPNGRCTRSAPAAAWIRVRPTVDDKARISRSARGRRCRCARGHCRERGGRRR